jgi:restriction system protein
MATMWMVRGDGGSLYEDFRERGVVSIGWWQLGPYVTPGISRKQLTEAFAKAEPQLRQGTIVAGASQVWRFIKLPRSFFPVTPDRSRQRLQTPNRTFPMPHWILKNRPASASRT